MYNKFLLGDVLIVEPINWYNQVFPVLIHLFTKKNKQKLGKKQPKVAVVCDSIVCKTKGKNYSEKRIKWPFYS